MKKRHGGQLILGQPLISNPLAKIVTSGGEITDTEPMIGFGVRIALHWMPDDDLDKPLPGEIE